jgi:hypothetical protein
MKKNAVILTDDYCWVLLFYICDNLNDNENLKSKKISITFD